MIHAVITSENNFKISFDSLKQSIEPTESELQDGSEVQTEEESTQDQNDSDDLNQIDLDLNPKPQTSSVWGRFLLVPNIANPLSLTFSQSPLQ